MSLPIKEHTTTNDTKRIHSKMLFTTLQGQCKHLLTNFNPKPFKGEGNKYHFVYVIQNTENDMLYIGKRSSRSLDDGYLGSGVSIRQAKSELGEDAFQRKELSFFQNAQEALEAEAMLLRSKIVQDASESFYNLQGFDWDLDSSRKKDQAKKSLADLDDLPSSFQQRTSIEICFNDSLKLVCDSFVDTKGVRWYNSRDAHVHLSNMLSNKPSMFLLHNDTKKTILTITNNQHLSSTLLDRLKHQNSLPIEILSKVSYSLSNTKLGTYFCHPLFVKYCCYLSSEAEVSILRGVQIQVKELSPCQLSLDI
jgi:hypothetical protein